MKIINYIFLLLLFVVPSWVKADSTYNYLALGDSITKGYGIEDKKDTYTNQVKEYLNQILSSQIILDNQAINGITSQTLYEHIQKEVIIEKIKKANLITLSIGSNDFLQELMRNIPSYYLGTTNLKNLKNISENLYQNMEKIYHQIYNLNNDVVIIILPLYNPYKELLHTKVNLEFEEIQRQYIEQIETIQKNTKKPIYVMKNLTAILENKVNLNLNIQNGNLDPHPNIEGKKKIAQEINILLNTLYNCTKPKISIQYYLLGILILVIGVYRIYKMKRKTIKY